jgi:hypothetical protein
MARVVLKLLAPWAAHAIASEALALSAWRGYGVVELLECTPEGRALLLRRIEPAMRSFLPATTWARSSRLTKLPALVPRDEPPRVQGV